MNAIFFLFVLFLDYFFSRFFTTILSNIIALIIISSTFQIKSLEWHIRPFIEIVRVARSEQTNEKKYI